MWEMYTEADVPEDSQPEIPTFGYDNKLEEPDVAPPPGYADNPAGYWWDPLFGAWMKRPDQPGGRTTPATPLFRGQDIRPPEYRQEPKPEPKPLAVPDDISKKGGGVVEPSGRAHTVAPPAPDLPGPVATIEEPEGEGEDQYKEMLMLLISYIQQALSQGLSPGEIVNNADYRKLNNALPSGHQAYAKGIINKSVGMGLGG